MRHVKPINNGKDCHKQSNAVMTPTEASPGKPFLQATYTLRLLPSLSGNLPGCSITFLVLKNMLLLCNSTVHKTEGKRYIPELLLYLSQGKKLQDFESRLRILVFCKKGTKAWIYSWKYIVANTFICLLHRVFQAILGNAKSTQCILSLASLSQCNPSSMWQALSYLIAAIMPPQSSFL